MSKNLSTKMVCPGQDTRFWRPGDIFDIACSVCGAMVEFFKDDARRRCAKCGNEIVNPRLSLGCAQWCEYAEKCLGYVPEKGEKPDGGEVSFVDRLARAAKAALGDEQVRLETGLKTVDYARELLRTEQANPRVVLSAALLHDLGRAAVNGESQTGLALARQVMTEMKLDADIIDLVCRIIAGDPSAETSEFRVVWDAVWLARLTHEHPSYSREEAEARIGAILKTEAGKKKLADLLSAAGR